MYGTRDAARNWECELGDLLEEIGLRRGQASTHQNSEEASGLSASVHGGDVPVKDSREDGEWLMFRERCEIETQMFVEAADLNKQLPDHQQNGTKEFPRTLDRSRPAPCEIGDQSSESSKVPVQPLRQE